MTVRYTRHAAFTSIAAAFLFALTVNVRAQQPKSVSVPARTGQLQTLATPAIRVVKPVDDAKRAKLVGHVSSALRQAVDLGHLNSSTPAEHMVLVLSSSDQQKHELRRVLDQQQDKSSANYHQWVTPEQFGEHFGAADADIAKVSAWLRSQGFTVEDVSKSKRVLHFSGTTGQLERAFSTEMHSFKVGTETHVANNSDISVPEALQPVIAGVTLNNFFRKGHMGPVKQLKDAKQETYTANFTTPLYGNSSTSTHYVGPWDFATIYNTFPLLNKGINGNGTSIAVVGRSDILMSDVQTYRALFDLPNNDPIFIHAGRDNGIQPGDDGESDLDVEISGGIAPMAQLYFVIGTPTFLVDGITNSIQYIVENNTADIMSISYGSCESVEGAGGNEFNNQAFEQAAAQGISVFVAAGDNGPAECDDSNSSWEVYGYATGGEASTPYSVSVGGSQGYEANTYWAAATQQTAPYWGLSALSYIPEAPWNESKAASTSKSPAANLGGIWSGSGGISSYYIQPSWQRGSGVPTTDPAYVGGNWVTALNITSGGSGYTTTPTVTITGGGCTAEPTVIATLTSGSVSSLAFQYFNTAGTEKTGQGFGCTSAPTIAFTAAPTGGTTATATATVGPMVNTPALINGVPHRYTPDLALNAASDHDGTIFCSEGVCEFSTSGNTVTASNFGVVGGTSVAAPSMAGIQALINQANGGRQGMPGYIYYALSAAQSETNCNSTTPPAVGSNCAFQDVTQGDILICGLSTCTTAAQKMGWSAGTGYDFASGLGSVNAYNMATQWSSVTFNSTATTLGLSATSGIAQGTPITINGTVAATSGSGTPTGDVAFILSNGSIGQTLDISGDANNGGFNGPTAFATLSNGSYSAKLPNLPAGSYTVTARYGGDNTYASSLSAPVPVTVNGGNATVTITPALINLATCANPTPTTSFSYGSPIYTTINVASNTGAGVPTGNVNITVDGVAFGTQPLDPNGNAYIIVGNYGTSSSCLYDYIFTQGPFLTGGTHQIGVSYAGDSTFSAIAANPASVNVSTLSVTPVLTVGAQTITSGFTVPLNATFTVTALTTGMPTTATGPTGTVTFMDTTTGATLGTATVIPTSAYNVTAGSTSSYPSYTFGATAAGSTTGITTSGANAVTAVYSGDVNYAATTSAVATVTVSGTVPVATTTTVTSSANPTTLGGRPTFTATIGAASGTVPTSGTATFYDGTTYLGVGTVGTSHTATLKLATSPAFVGGTHSITAVYGGITANAPSTSAALIQTVTKATAPINLNVKPAGLAAQSYTLAAVLTPSTTNSYYTPTLSNVQFFDGTTLLGAALAIDVNGTQGGYGLWTATLTVSGLAPGSHPITAQYSDTNYNLTTSSTQTIEIISTIPGRIWAVNGNTTMTYLGTTGTINTMGTAAGTSTVGGVALDAMGEAWWTTGMTSNTLYFASIYSATPTAYTGGGLNTPVAVAVDGSGYIWIANSGNGTVSEFVHSGTTVTAFTRSTAYSAAANGATTGTGTSSIAIDNSGGVWVTNKTGGSVTHIFGVATPVTTSLTKAVTNGTLGTKP